MNIGWKSTKAVAFKILIIFLVLGLEWCLLIACIQSQLLGLQTALLILLGSAPFVVVAALFAEAITDTKLYKDVSICNDTLIRKLEDTITITKRKKIMSLEACNVIKVTAKYKERELIFRVGYENCSGETSAEVRFYYEFQLELMNPPKQKFIVRDYMHPTPDTWIQGKYVCFLYEWVYDQDVLSSRNYDWVRGGTVTGRDKKEKINLENIKNRNIVQELDYLCNLAVRVDNGEFNAGSG